LYGEKFAQYCDMFDVSRALRLWVDWMALGRYSALVIEFIRLVVSSDVKRIVVMQKEVVVVEGRSQDGRK
jgi:hypothetical protein